MNIPSLKERKLERILGNLEKMIGSVSLMAIGIISYWFVNYEKFSNLQYALFIMALVLLLCLGIILVDMYLIFFKQLYHSKD